MTTTTTIAMPFPFVLPTTSAFSFSASFACPTHPSLLRNASTYRGVVRDTLKKHKRLPPEAQAANLALVVSSLQNYLPYLFALVAGLRGGGSVRVTRLSDKDGKDKNGLGIEWRPTLAASRLPGKEAARARVDGLDGELAFALSTLGLAWALQARAALQPLYVVASVVPVGGQQRAAAITAATRHLLDAAAVFAYAADDADAAPDGQSPPDISGPVLRSQAALALAEATLLAVLKDDPYPAVVAQARNDNDREWMYKAPDLPKVRAHLFARLCLAAADHAARAAASVTGPPLRHALSAAFVRYLDDLQHTSRAKACRFFAIDADLGGETGTALAWVHAALHALDVEDADGGSSSGGGHTSAGGSQAGDKRKHLLGRFRKERSEKREDRRVERGLAWGADAGRFEETRVLELLDAKWTKQNDTINTQRIPPAGPLLAQMPSGREIHSVKPWVPPALDAGVLEDMRVPPDPLDEDDVGASSSDDNEPPGAPKGSRYY